MSTNQKTLRVTVIRTRIEQTEVIVFNPTDEIESVDKAKELVQQIIDGDHPTLSADKVEWELISDQAEMEEANTERTSLTMEEAKRHNYLFITEE